MMFLKLLQIEWMKLKRSGMIPLLFPAPLLVVGSGVANLSMYFTPEYTNAWAAMFMQSALLYAYYLLPFSMIVACVTIAGRETQNNGILKMLALPVERHCVSLTKFCVLACCLLMEMVVFLAVFLAAGLVATHTSGITETMPLAYLATWCVKLFLAMLPSTAVMWALTVAFEKPILSVGLNLLLVIPGLLAGATPVWFLYPYCYSGYLVSRSLHAFTANGADTALQSVPFVPCAALIFASALLVSAKQFGKKEMR